MYIYLFNQMDTKITGGNKKKNAVLTGGDPKKNKIGFITSAYIYVAILVCYYLYANHALKDVRDRYYMNLNSNGGSIPIPFLEKYGNCLAEQSPYSRLEPPENTFYIGISFGSKLLDSTSALSSYGLRRPLAVYGTRFKFKSGEKGGIENRKKLDELVKLIARLGSILHLEIDSDDIEFESSPDDYENFAESLLRVNRDVGVPILLSWGSGMNNPNKRVSIDPVKYTSSFRILSSKIKSKTNLTALIWQPSILAIAEDRDTPDGDSGYNQLLKYWPGSSHADWIGVSAFEESLKDTQFKDKFEHFYQKFSLGHAIDRPLPLAIISSKHSFESLMNSGGIQVGNETSWDFLTSYNFLTEHPNTKLIMLPEFNESTGYDTLHSILAEFNSGQRVVLLGSNHEISFVCSGMVNCRTSKNIHILNRISHPITTGLMIITRYVESLYLLGLKASGYTADV